MHPSFPMMRFGLKCRKSIVSNRIVYTPVAIQDLEELIAYISQDNPKAATKIVGEIREKIALLTEFPLMGRALSDIGNGEYRAIVINNYVAFYVVIGGEVQIRRILHGARRYGSLLE